MNVEGLLYDLTLAACQPPGIRPQHLRAVLGEIAPRMGALTADGVHANPLEVSRFLGRAYRTLRGAGLLETAGPAGKASRWIATQRGGFTSDEVEVHLLELRADLRIPVWLPVSPRRDDLRRLKALVDLMPT